jgi:hypothetical protein
VRQDWNDVSPSGADELHRFVTSHQAGRDSNPDSLCAAESGMETRPAKLSQPALIEKFSLFVSIELKTF